MTARPGEPEAALEVYRRRRVLRTARVQLQSRAVGEHVYHPTGAHAALRNAIMSAKRSGATPWLGSTAARA